MNFLRPAGQSARKTNPVRMASRDGLLLLSDEQRSLLSERIYRRLAGVDPTYLVASSEGRVSYEELSQTHEELTLLVKDLVRGGDQVAVSTPRPVVRKVIERLLSEAEELAPEIDVTQAAEENSALVDLCQRLLTDLAAVELQQGVQRLDPQALPPADRWAQREVVVAALEALPSHLTAEQIIAGRLPHHDHDQSELLRALSAVVELEILQLTSSGAIIPSPGLLRINELFERLWASI
jgi:hypothetical protein